MKQVVVKNAVVMMGLILSAGIGLSACSSNSPEYVGSIKSPSSTSNSQRTLDNREISTIIDELRNDVSQQRKALAQDIR